MSEQAFAVQRHEHKFLLAPAEALCLRGALSGVLRRDAHAGPGGYFIRSLYFDTPDARDYEEKLLGVSTRHKLRLRIYSPDADTAKLEIKNKRGQTSRKETAVISRADALALAAGDYDILTRYQNPTAQRFFSLLKTENRLPAVLVDYEREAFVSPVEDIRITFDRNIRAAKSCALFDPAVPTVGLHSGAVTVLEVKYNRFLPRHISALLSCHTMQEQSVSKYCTARAMLY